MNRVKRISRRYDEQRPQIDRERAIRSHTRRARKAAIRVTQANAHLETLRNALHTKNMKELKALAADLNVKGRSKMTKKQLVEELIKA
jgi:hypothetical protein